MRINFGFIRRQIASAAPVITLFIAVVLMLLPLRIGFGAFEIPMPLVPFIVVFLYSVYDPTSLPTSMVFVLGVLQDLLYGSALGVWAAIYLGVQYLVLTQRDYLRGRLPHVIWLAFALAICCLMPLLWASRSLFAGQFLPAWGLIYQVAVTIALYPLCSRLFFVLRDNASREVPA